MATQIQKRKCKHCRLFFSPDPRNAWHQKVCSKPECRKASKAASQKRWLDKEENRDHFRGPENVRRVQEWRKAHPGYWRRKTSKKSPPLQEVFSAQTLENHPFQTSLTQGPLQDLFSAQSPLVIGLIAHFTGSALQEDIAFALRRMQQLGIDILHRSPLHGGRAHAKAPDLLPTDPQDPRPVQLGRSPSGP